MKNYILKFKYKFIIICILILVRQIFLMKSNFLNADAITVLTKKDLNVFLKIIFLLSITWLIIIVIDRIVKVREEIFLQDIGIDIKNNLSRAIVELDIENYKENSVGVYQSWFNNDIQIIQNKGIRNIFFIVYNVSGIVFSLYALLKYHWLISITTVLGTLILMLLPKLFNKKLQNIGGDVTKENENYVAKLEETILGYDTYFSLNKLNIIPIKINEISTNLKNIFIKQSKLESNYYMANFGVNVFFQVLLVFITGYLVIKNNLEVGAIAAVGMFSNIVFDGMSQIGYRISLIKGVKPIFSKYDNFISNIKNNNLIINYSDKAPLFKIKNLNFEFNDKNIFNNFNLEIIEGNKYLIYGDSGVGKSTLFKIITGQLKNYKGSVSYRGLELKNLSSKNILDNISFIGQDIFVFSGTVRDNIVFNEDSDNNEVEKCLIKVGFSDIDEFINKEVGPYGKNLSGGQKQRIALARALFSRKKILLLDEVTSALDKESAKNLELMLLKNKDLTVLMISHDISNEAKELFDYSIKISN